MKNTTLFAALLVIAPLLTGCGGSEKKPASSFLGKENNMPGGALTGAVSGFLPGILNANGGALSRVFTGILEKKTWKKESLPNIDQVAANVYRGGQPRPGDGYAQLKAAGIRTVINLRMEAPDADDEAAALGMNVVYIPMPDTAAPTREQVRQFRAAVAQGGPTFFHCSAGSYRTGTMAAILKIDAGASAEEALADMRAHGFHDNWQDAPKEVAFVRAYAANPEAWR